MIDHASFVRAICADPDDITLRLVYADFLEDIGEMDRSSFIRVQCELASWNCLRADARARQAGRPLRPENTDILPVLRKR